MPRLWLTAAAALALAGPGLAQEAALPDSLTSALAPPDSLSQAAPPAPAALPEILSPSPPPLVVVAPVPSSTPVLPRLARFSAQQNRLLSFRTLWGAAFIAGGAVLYGKGGDYRQKADDLYERYKGAADPVEIETLYQRTTNQDTKGQVCWALSAALAINGVRLLLTRDTEVVSASLASRPSLDLVLLPRSLQLRVRKWL